MDSGNLEVQEASSAWVFGDAGGKQWVSGGARGKLGVQKESSWYLEVQEAGCVCLEAQDSKKNLCDDPFQTVPGSIPGSCIPAFTGTRDLGHVVTTTGLKTNPKLTASVLEFPRPQNLKELQRFLGLTSYYRRFVPNFAKVASPLYRLTAKDVTFTWSDDCKTAFVLLKGKLATPPVLAYPSFSRDFTLETDASIQGLGAVLSQVQDDGKLHPVAYASRALSPGERNYSVTELETLLLFGLFHISMPTYMVTKLPFGLTIVR